MSTKQGGLIGIADVQTLDFGKGDGLLPAVVQDADSGAVLMLGYMNREALRATFERRRVVFFSRSKQRLWDEGRDLRQHARSRRGARRLRPGLAARHRAPARPGLPRRHAHLLRR